MSSNPKKQNQLHPELRFPEFRNSEGWKKQPLEKFLDYQQPTPYLVADTKYSDVYETPVLTAGKTFLLGYTNEKHGIFRDGLPVIIFDDFTTATQFVNFPFKAKSSAMKILQAKNGASIKFMYEAMKMISYEVGTHERHWISKFAPMHIPIPIDSKEQQKISDCLSSLDELIETDSAKLENLQQHKKGLMQELFPAENEMLPKRRFKEFQFAPDWKIMELGSISKIVRGGSPRPIDDYLTNEANALNWLKIGDVNKDSKYVIKTQERVIASALNKSREVSPGDLIMSNSMSFGRPYILKIKACIHDGWIAITEISKGVSLDYLYYFILSNSSQSYFLRSAAGSGVKNLNADIIKLLNVALPKLQEQKAIADCLAMMDELITAQSKKVDMLRTHKKALMQQIFPAMQELR